MPVNPTLTPTSAAESTEIKRRLGADGFVHIAGVIEHSALDAVEAEMADALRCPGCGLAPGWAHRPRSPSRRHGPAATC